MIVPFWARVVTPTWVGRFEVSCHGIITFCPPITSRWKGRKFEDLLDALKVGESLVEMQMYPNE